MTRLWVVQGGEDAQADYPQICGVKLRPFDCRRNRIGRHQVPAAQPPDSAMLADSMRYPFDSGNLGVSRFWVARNHVIPVTARGEDPGKDIVSKLG
jgi:hypothetical protein